ncbi:glycosyltransferase family 9 protein [Sphaerisporangium fuscum]|uniref:glycosyltransferase family 9 protein n=1 Tax=Sphaerisporangium fuscum TaxID=2835868 RepID=UPI001BDD54C3|nr:glycosyltransferase family 9 protein [Sphaerisporangium fuscum]
MVQIADRALDGHRGARWFFGEIIEPICDSFDPDVQHLHDRLMAYVLAEAARRNPLLVDEVDIAHVAATRDSTLAARRPALCVIPSRVTIGADVTVTGTIAAVVRAAWPEVPLALLGSVKHLEPLLGQFSGTEVWNHPYPRHGTIQERIRAWSGAARAVRAWQARYPHAELLVLDPDSRLTQLGLLRLGTGRVGVRIFSGRHTATWDRRDLGALAADWARAVVGLPREAAVGPRIMLPDAETAWGSAIVKSVRDRCGLPVVVVSLGVGGKDTKGLSPREEVDVLRRVSERAAILLDTGGTAEEERRAREAAYAWGSRTGGRVWCFSRQDGDPEPALHGLGLIVGATVADVGGLLAAADGYVGYDSAFQHVAAALGVPAVALFVEAPSDVFVDRWRPEGVAAVMADGQVMSRLDTALEVLNARRAR